MSDLTVTAVLSLFDTNKEGRKLFVDSLLSRIEGGRVDALKAHIQVKCMEDIIKQITSNQDYKKLVEEEARKHGQKIFTLGNAEISIRESGVTYDYSVCNDYVHSELIDDLNDIKEKLAMREQFLKQVPPNGFETITEGGEVVTLYPPARTSTTSTVVKLK